MKQVYEAPRFEVETYELDANIAGNCKIIVTMGDYGGADDTEKACNDYLGLVGKPLLPVEPVDPQAYNVTFWEHSCDCYTTAGGEGFFTS